MTIFVTNNETSLKIAYGLAEGPEAAVPTICLNLINGTQVNTYETCFAGPTEGELNSFTVILGYAFESNICSWANITQDTTIDFSVLSDLNSTTFSALPFRNKYFNFS